MKWLIAMVMSLGVLVPEAFASGGGSHGGSSITHQMMLLMLQLGVIIFTAKMGGLLFQRMKVPAVLGELCSGMLIGPYMLGQIVLPGLPEGLFPLGEGFPLSTELYGICTLAAVVLLFIVGLECDVKLFIRFSLAGTAVGIGGVVGSFVLGALTMSLFSEYAFGVSLGFFDPPCLFLGVLSTATSVGITARILSEKRKLAAPEGVTILAGAVVDDVLGIILLAIVLGAISAGQAAGGIDWGQIGIIGAKAVGIWLISTALGLVLARRISRLLKGFGDPISIAIMALALALVVAGLFEEAGLAMIIGAYVAGLSLSQTDISRLVQEKLDPVQRLLVPIFFCCMGMLVNFHAMSSPRILLFGLIFSAVAVVAKAVGCAIPALFFQFNLRGATRIAAGMIPRGEVALIIAGIGMASGVLGPGEFGVAIMMTILTTLFAPVLLVFLFKNPASGSTRAMPPTERIRLTFPFPSEDLAEALREKLLKAFAHDGFYVHALHHDIGNVFEIRQNETLLEIRREGAEIIIDCDRGDENIIHSSLVDVTTDLRRSLEGLNQPFDQTQFGKNLMRPAERQPRLGLDLGAYITPKAILPRLQAATKAGVLEEMLNHLVRLGAITEVEPLLSQLIAREQIVSTGFENGFALPHVKTPAVRRMVCVVGIHPDGIDFDAIDGQPSRLFVLELAPDDATGPHLQFMAAISHQVNLVGQDLLKPGITAEEIHRRLTENPGSSQGPLSARH